MITTDSWEAKPPLLVALSFLAFGISHTLRTLVYIDGFNLYHGCLKQLPHCRWLDIETLATRLCAEVDENTDILAIKYFTAPILERLSPKGSVSAQSLQAYVRALEVHCKKVKIIQGKYIAFPGTYYAADKRDKIDFNQKLRVMRPEEKQTDVNIALHMLADATDGECDQQVLFSNDSDYAPVLQMIKDRHPEIIRGLVPPILAGYNNRHASTDVLELADWNHYPINQTLLEKCQLPDKVPTRKKPFVRPKHWM